MFTYVYIQDFQNNKSMLHYYTFDLLRAIASSTALSCFNNSSRRELAFFAAFAAAAATLALLSINGGDSKPLFFPAIKADRSTFFTAVVLFGGFNVSLICCLVPLSFKASIPLESFRVIGGVEPFLRRVSLEEEE